jgi:RNA polymerase sigma-70 factor (ECF subfamily)
MATVDERSDSDLLRQLALDDRFALAELYRRHSPWLLARLSRRCADPDVVDQALQDTFVAVWRKPGSYRASGEVAAWMWGIAIRRLIDQLRRRPAALHQLDPHDASSPSAEEQALSRVQHGDLAGAFDRLSPELRAVVQATVLDGLTTREAGRLLGIPAGTVKTRMMRAKPLLREGLI